jgi:hypothetical protein
MTPEHRALMVRALATYPFRERGIFEGERQYMAALIAHVADRDLAMAHELRVGRRQAEWTPDDVAQFRELMLATHRPPRETLGPRTSLMVMDAGYTDPTDDALDALAEAGLVAYVERKTEAPTDTPPIMATVLLATGQVLITQADRGDRVAILKTVARELPVFGFFLCCDVFIHEIPVAGEPGTGQKREALVLHLGTRERRVMMVRPYQVIAGRAVFADPPPPNIDKRDPGTVVDPYATVFAAPLHRTTQ